MWFKRPKKQTRSATEKRRAERYAHPHKTEVQHSERVHDVTVRDISLTGVRFSTDHEIPADRVARIRINYNPIHFPLRVHVIWNRPEGDQTYEHGAEFINVPEDEMRLLVDHLEDIKAAITPDRK